MDLKTLLATEFTPGSGAEYTTADLQSLEAVDSLSDADLESVHSQLHTQWDGISSPTSDNLRGIMDLIAAHKWVAMALNGRKLNHPNLSGLDSGTMTDDAGEPEEGATQAAKALGRLPDEITWVPDFVSIGKAAGMDAAVVYGAEQGADGLALKVDGELREGLTNAVKSLLAFHNHELPDAGKLLSLYDLKLVRKAEPEVIDGPEPEANEPDPEASEATTKAFSSDIQIVSKKKAQQVLTGIVLSPEETDGHNEVIGADVIEKAAYDFLAHYNTQTRVGLLHLQMNRDVHLVESYIAPNDLSIGGQAVVKGAWLVSIKVIDPVIWAAVEDGTLTGLSIGGLYQTVEETDGDT